MLEASENFWHHSYEAANSRFDDGKSRRQNCLDSVT